MGVQQKGGKVRRNQQRATWFGPVSGNVEQAIANDRPREKRKRVQQFQVALHGGERKRQPKRWPRALDVIV
jgi:hypothetical protein